VDGKMFVLVLAHQLNWYQLILQLLQQQLQQRLLLQQQLLLQLLLLQLQQQLLQQLQFVMDVTVHKNWQLMSIQNTLSSHQTILTTILKVNPALGLSQTLILMANSRSTLMTWILNQALNVKRTNWPLTMWRNLLRFLCVAQKFLPNMKY